MDGSNTKPYNIDADSATGKISCMQEEILRLRRLIEALHIELEEARKLLAHAVKEADGWHDECRGGPIEGDALIDAARQLSPNTPTTKPDAT